MTNNRRIQVGLAAILILLFGAVVYLGVQALKPPQFGDLGDDKVADAKEPREPIVSPRTDGVLDPDSGDVIPVGLSDPLPTSLRMTRQASMRIVSVTNLMLRGITAKPRP